MDGLFNYLGLSRIGPSIGLLVASCGLEFCSDSHSATSQGGPLDKFNEMMSAITGYPYQPYPPRDPKIGGEINELRGCVPYITLTKSYLVLLSYREI
ncbi:hypothetical protein Hanom_Chr13g01196071 [Helianthus anomalus]